MTRAYSSFNTDRSRALLRQIADRTTSPQDYQDAMRHIGEHFGETIVPMLDRRDSLYLACTVEDADYLAKGMLSKLEEAFQSVSLACFWNIRFAPFSVQDLKAAPVIREYSEKVSQNVDILVIVKSVISGGCVVRTNLTNLIQTVSPKAIFIVAPVIYSGAQERLSKHFDVHIREKFQFVYLAEDDEKSAEGEVLPGIGGMVYERLGFKGQDDKNRYTPDIVKSRRRLALKA